MKQNLSRNPLVFGTVLFSFAWNILLMVGVILNLGFSHTRAAGGQFTDFPSAIRVLYVLQVVQAHALASYLQQYLRGGAPSASRHLLLLFGLLPMLQRYFQLWQVLSMQMHLTSHLAPSHIVSSIRKLPSHGLQIAPYYQRQS